MGRIKNIRDEGPRSQLIRFHNSNVEHMEQAVLQADKKRFEKMEFNISNVSLMVASMLIKSNKMRNFNFPRDQNIKAVAKAHILNEAERIINIIIKKEDKILSKKFIQKLGETSDTIDTIDPSQSDLAKQISDLLGNKIFYLPLKKQEG